MPIIQLKRDRLFKALGKNYTEEEFQKLCFEFGIELDDVTSALKMRLSQLGIDEDEFESLKKSKKKDAKKKLKELIEKLKDNNGEMLSEEVIYKIELPANKYDTLCEEGLVSALKIFLGQSEVPDFKLLPEKPTMQIVVDEHYTQTVRRYVVCAILRDVSFDEHIFDNFLALQDKLHQNVCRERSLVAIGTHDLDTIKGPFLYTAKKPEEIKFVPLEQKKEFNGKELIDFYNTDVSVKHIKPYVKLISESERYPVIYDANGIVCSLPPLINGDHSKMSADTKNIFIECTATDHTKAKVVLSQMVAAFSQYCKNKFTIEPVEVIYKNAETKEERREITPDLSKKEFECSVSKMNKLIGINVGMEKTRALLKKMQIDTEVIDEDRIKAFAPITRSDVIHSVDIAEDLGIAYGYNNIKVTVPNTYTIAQEEELNKLCDSLRYEIAMYGYNEIYTLSLLKLEEIFDNMNLPRTKILDGKEVSAAVLLGNAKSSDFQCLRTSLIPPMLKTISHNKGKISLPIKFFEVNDVCLRTNETDTGSINQRNLCIGFSDKSSQLEYVHGALDRAMEVLKIPFNKGKKSYFLKKADHPSFLFHADVMYDGKKIGDLGVIHPTVLKAFRIEQPVSICEISVEQFVENSKLKQLFIKNIN